LRQLGLALRGGGDYGSERHNAPFAEFALYVFGYAGNYIDYLYRFEVGVEIGDIRGNGFKYCDVRGQSSWGFGIRLSPKPSQWKVKGCAQNGE
jgi:hypothetical protein